MSASEPQPQSYPTAVGVPEFPPVTLAHGEMVKRQWLISRMSRLGWIDSSLTVTDARVIYRARAKSFLGFSSNWRELHIQDVSGAALATRRGLTPLNLLAIVTGFIIAVIAIQLFDFFTGGFARAFTGAGPSGWTVLFYVLLILITAIIVIVRYFSKEIVLVIYARSIDASPISVSGSEGRPSEGILAKIAAGLFTPVLLLAEWLGLADASAATNQADPRATQLMYDEFGALVLDLQNRGVRGGSN